jgi:hypothetical protein
MTIRCVSASLGTACALGIALAAPAAADEPGYFGYYGLSSEYPPGTCIDVPQIDIDVDQLKNLRPVPCDSGFRDERVVQWASSEAECIQPIDATIWTVDGVLLCTVWDYT